MSRLVDATITDRLTIAGEVIVELTWLKPELPRNNFGELLKTFDGAGMNVPTSMYTETRFYASIEIAQRAIDNLFIENKKTA